MENKVKFSDGNNAVIFSEYIIGYQVFRGSTLVLLKHYAMTLFYGDDTKGANCQLKDIEKLKNIVK